MNMYGNYTRSQLIQTIMTLKNGVIRRVQNVIPLVVIGLEKYKVIEVTWYQICMIT